MIKKTEDGYYICLPGRRYIYSKRHGKIIGWYDPKLAEVLE